MCTPNSVSHILLVLVFVGRTVTQTVPALSLSLSLYSHTLSFSFVCCLGVLMFCAPPFGEPFLVFQSLSSISFPHRRAFNTDTSFFYSNANTFKTLTNKTHDECTRKCIAVTTTTTTTSQSAPLPQRQPAAPNIRRPLAAITTSPLPQSLLLQCHQQQRYQTLSFLLLPRLLFLLLLLPQLLHLLLPLLRLRCPPPRPPPLLPQCVVSFILISTASTRK